MNRSASSCPRFVPFTMRAPSLRHAVASVVSNGRPWPCGSDEDRAPDLLSSSHIVTVAYDAVGQGSAVTDVRIRKQ